MKVLKVVIQATLALLVLYNVGVGTVNLVYVMQGSRIAWLGVAVYWGIALVIWVVMLFVARWSPQKQRGRMEMLRKKIKFLDSPPIWLQGSHPAWIRCVTRTDLARVPDGPCIFMVYVLTSGTPEAAFIAGQRRARMAPTVIGNSSWSKFGCNMELITWRHHLETLLYEQDRDHAVIVLVAPQPDASPEELNELCEWIESSADFRFLGPYLAEWDHK